jgi:hypothetical protein
MKFVSETIEPVSPLIVNCIFTKRSPAYSVTHSLQTTYSGSCLKAFVEHRYLSRRSIRDSDRDREVLYNTLDRPTYRRYTDPSLSFHALASMN